MGQLRPLSRCSGDAGCVLEGSFHIGQSGYMQISCCPSLLIRLSYKRINCILALLPQLSHALFKGSDLSLKGLFSFQSLENNEIVCPEIADMLYSPTFLHYSSLHKDVSLEIIFPHCAIA